MLYIVHVNVLHDAREEWEPYMRDHHIDEVLDTGCFCAAWMARDAERDTDDSVAFTMCYESLDDASFERYMRDHAPALKLDHAERFAGRVQATRELLPIIKRFTR
jgi:hypothetical protein